MESLHWFSARCAFRHPGLPSPEGASVFEERLILLRASDPDKAITKAELEARAYSAALELEFLGFVSVYDLEEESPGEGVEIYSVLRTCALDPDEYVSRFLDTGTEHSQTADDGL